MQNAYTALVNHKLSKVRILLSLMTETPAGLVARQANTTLAESAVLQLSLALALWFREMATHFKFSAPEQIDTIASVVAAAADKGLISLEVSEWRELDQQGWVGELRRWCETITSPPLPVPRAPRVDDSLIVAIAADDADVLPPLTPARVRGYLTAMEALMQRQREVMSEF